MKINNINNQFNLFAPSKNQKIFQGFKGQSNSFLNSITKDTFERSANVSFTSKTDDIHGMSFDDAEVVFDLLDKFVNYLRTDIDTERLQKYPNRDVALPVFNFVDNIKNDSDISAEGLDISRCGFAVFSFLSKSGINTSKDLLDVVNVLKQVENFDELYGKFPAEFLMVYSSVKNKQNIVMFPYLSKTIHGSIVNSVALRGGDGNEVRGLFNLFFDYLDKIGVSDEKQSFYSRFRLLAPYYNYFKSDADKYTAVGENIAVHDRKMKILQSLLAKLGIEESVEQVYGYYGDILDFYFIKNSGMGFGKIEEYLKALVDIKGLKGYPKTCADKTFETASSSLIALDFVKKLDDMRISTEQFSRIYSAPPVIEDVDESAILDYYNTMCRAISRVLGVEKSQARSKYEDFGDCIISIHKNDEGTIYDLVSFLNQVQKYKISNSKAFLNFYRKCCESNSKKDKKKQSYAGQNINLNSSKLLEFVRLLEFDNTDDLLKTARLKGTSAYRYLESEKKYFESIESKIEEFLLSDKNTAFIGLTPIDIFKKYRKDLKNNLSGTQVVDVLEHINTTEAKKNADSQKQKDYFEKFSKYFEDKKSVLRFIENSEISFSSENEEMHAGACLELLEVSKQRLNPEEYNRFVGALSENHFLEKSALDSESVSELSLLCGANKKLMLLIADKKISDIKSLLSLLNEYKDSDSQCDKVIDFFYNHSFEHSIKEINSALTRLKNQCKNCGLSISIDNTNIEKIPSDYLFKNDISDDEFKALLEGLSEGDDSGINYLRFYPELLDNTKFKYSKTSIIENILTSEEDKISYPNARRLFDLDTDINALANPRNTYQPYEIRRTMEDKLPSEFVNLINSDDLINFMNDSAKIPNIVLHAKLRLIERFALGKYENREDIDWENVISDVQSVLKTIYTSNPVKITRKNDNTLTYTYSHKDSELKAVFSKDGALITVVAPDEENNFRYHD